MKKQKNRLFVGGDLSGIQKFLYNISSRKAAVSLKGRSFYLRQYMENVCRELQSEMEAAGSAGTEVIYCSGGKFYMLGDDTESIRLAIDRFSQGVRLSLWDKHLGQLGINLGYVSFHENTDGTVDAEGLEHQPPGILWRTVNAGFAHQKSQKFRDVIMARYQEFFTPIAVGGTPRVCAVTGVESPHCVWDDGIEAYVLPSVKEQIQLGEMLRRQQQFKTFEEYADGSDLGILRMDVDGLGKRFIDGFESIAAYRSFSTRLVGFFEHGVEKLQQLPEFRDYLNIIYAGGDDLFVVGRWDKVIAFGERVHVETEQRFGDEGISISGGVAIVKPKFPIAKSAEMAGEAEEAAKRFRGGEKNAFHLLGRTVSWKDEFTYVKSYQQQFVSLIENFSLSKGILHRIMLYASIADRNKVRRQKGLSEDFSYVWHVSYYLTRYMERYKSNPAVLDFCKTLRDREIPSNKGRNLELLAVAARWAELLLKYQSIK